MDKQAIYDALNPDWWTQRTNTWNTTFVSTIITYQTAALPECFYVSSAPIQTGGLSAGTDAPTTDLETFVDVLRHEAAQRLYDLHCAAVTGHTSLSGVFNATA